MADDKFKNCSNYILALFARDHWKALLGPNLIRKLATRVQFVER